MRRRLLWSIGLLGLVLCIGFGIMTFAVFFMAEDRAYKRLLQSASQSGEGGVVVVYNGAEADLPPDLLPYTVDRSPGQHEVELDNFELHIAIREKSDGGRQVVFLRVPELPMDEKLVSLGIWIGILFGTLTSVALAFLLSLRVVGPIERITAWLRRADPSEPPPQDLPDEELRLLAHALDGYLKQQDTLVARERAFLREASHELRTPISVVRGVCELAEDQGLPEEGLARISRSVQRMEHTVEGLLSLARQEVTIAPADFEAEWQAMAKEFEETVGGSCQLRAALSNPPREALAIRMLILLIGILLRNVRDHAAASLVDVQLDSSALTFSDNGSGFAELPDLVSALDRQFPLSGGGLGLSIVARICRRMDWSLHLSNRRPGAQIRVEF